MQVYGERFEFQKGEKMRLFFSYRYPTDRVVSLLSKYQLSLLGQWITTSGEEGIFSVRQGEGTGTFSGFPARP